MLLEDVHTLEYTITHVFSPLRLPDCDDYTVSNDASLAEAVCAAARAYTEHISSANLPQWNNIIRMLENLHATIRFERLDQREVVSQVSGMRAGDILAFLIRAQNAAVVFRKAEHTTLCESMEVSPKADTVIAARGKLICSYPGPAIEVPNYIFGDATFTSELANFLSHMHEDVLDSAASCGAAVEEKDTLHPRYITELLTGILRAVGHPADITRISKRVGDDVVRGNRSSPWRRTPLWLLVRVTLQTSLARSTLGLAFYKQFMLFLMCTLAQKAIDADLPNDVLHCISTKISRRFGKLGSSTSEWLSSIALSTCQRLRTVLEKRWLEVQAIQSVSPCWTPSELDWDQDTQLSLLSSHDYIHSALTNDLPHPTNTPFQPIHHPRGTLDDFLDADGTSFEAAYRVDPFIALYDVERAIEQGIDTWLAGVMIVNEACVALEILASKYSSCAKRTYANHPEHHSIMLLTMIELWIAFDKLAIKATPMLADYNPEVPTSLLEGLLMRTSASFHRLRDAYMYLSRRHAHSHQEWSVFSDSISPDAFSVRYYDSSTRLKALKARIEYAAQRQVDLKIAELEQANALHAKLQRDAENTDHEFAMDDDGDEDHAEERCHKCQLEARIQGMKIKVYRWPLPAESLHALAVVFELDPPLSFSIWRSFTFSFLLEQRSQPLTSKSLPVLLHEYEALRHYFVRHPQSRISFGLYTNTPVQTQHIPAEPDKVCVPNNLQFHPCDIHSRTPILQTPGANIKCSYTHKLPAGPYHNLQRYLDGTSHTSNEVLANQADCHQDLSIHEFIAFGHLRSGGSLQWLNILRELRDRKVTFRRHESHLLFSQAAAQVGPLSDTGDMVWHQELQEPYFCRALLQELHNLVMVVEANWLEGMTMTTVSFLIGRILASRPDEEVVEKALSLLRIVREKTFFWTQELSEKLTHSSDDTELSWLLHDMAAICRSTFDVDPTFIRELLCSPKDVDALFSCAIYVHDNTPSDPQTFPAFSQLLRGRDYRLSLVTEDILNGVLHGDATQEGIDRAILRIWPNYRPGSKWEHVHPPSGRWLSCETAKTESQCSQIVHFNLLDGSLLVNGKPLSRLPDAILRHPEFSLIFGKQIVNVVPSDMPGMVFSTRGLISGHHVHFALRGNDLVIRAKRENTTDTIQLIPQTRLADDLPSVLVKDHAHWLNLSTSVIEIRRLDMLWTHSSDHWEIVCASGTYYMRKGHERLVDIRSQSWKMLASLLVPLDVPENLLVTVSSVVSTQNAPSHQLSVTLPRYGLSFFVDEDGDLQSHNLRGMVYDSNQSIGTLFGLVNQLVLRPKHQLELDLNPRCVLIPDGEVTFAPDGHHVRVDIETLPSLLRPVTYQTYRVDSELGCLTGNVSLTNKLYRAYLHALTSSACNTDPLTGRTGTEEALSLLRSAGCRSIMKVEPRDAHLLGLIASLCPSRKLHSSPVAQSVHWQNLPASSQHPELYTAAKAIRDHCNTVRLFQQNSDPGLFHDFPKHDNNLFERSAIRAAYLVPDELARRRSRDFDLWYHGRDSVEPESGEHRAYTAAYIVYHQSINTSAVQDITTLVKSWTSTVQGKALLSLQYESSWLNPDLPSIWIETYNQLRSSGEDWLFRLLFSLPAMAYGSSRLSDLVPAFVAFAIHPDFRNENPPKFASYHLSNGCEPDRQALSTYVLNSARSFEASPEGSSPPHLGESNRDLLQRRRRLWNERRNKDANTLVDTLLEAWPTETPPRFSLDSKLYRIASLTPKLKELFSSCYRNLQLVEHLMRVQEILKTVCAQGFPALSVTYTFEPSQSLPPRSSWLRTPDLLFAQPAPLLPSPAVLPRFTGDAETRSSLDYTPIRSLVSTFQHRAETQFQVQYASDLQTSSEHFHQDPTHSEAPITTGRYTTKMLRSHLNRCRTRFMQSFKSLCIVLGPTPDSRSEQALSTSGQLPRITAYTLFQYLASTSPITLSDDWKECLVQLALLALEVQRARRLLQLHSTRLEEEFRSELENRGCDGWDAVQHPDWLLIQLQGNFLVRRVQLDVAQQMISPPSNENTTMQLHMGQGKSSVIVPIAATALADGNQMVRVIVPKALTVQMFRLLVDRLGGLVNRPIYYLPFSRSLELNAAQAVTMHSIMEECMTARGVLVARPEHILSLRLVSVEMQLSRTRGGGLAGHLLKLQKWLYYRARDVLDESDEILHVRYQLMYTIGPQQPMEGFPDRWTTTQQILGLVKKHAPSLFALFPVGVVYNLEATAAEAFPDFRILQDNAGEELIQRIAQDVMKGFLPNFGFEHLPSGIRGAIHAFVTCRDISLTAAGVVQAYSAQSALWNGLLLLRGLLASGIILFALKERRWRVDYGLAPERTMLAVPYRAKDIPAQRAEFGHPDVAIILTCLSYYYQGLNDEQLKLSFELLLNEADPSIEYDLWIQNNPSVPCLLRNLTNINIRSTEQWRKHLLPCFYRNQATINFYLSRVIFPKEAKEFPSKLSCSGWDLAETRDKLVTGFSGTNDGRYLLPLTITQHDPGHQRGTNAKVLSYLLQPENNHYMITTHENGQWRKAREFLQMVVAQVPEIRVLLDVGAQILDLQNHQVAATWLELSPLTSAAIYFNEDDELMALARDGRSQLLLSSPFAQHLDQCVVYIDDAHTRGTDIKFPPGFRAAVTLGPKVTKDRLAQGCMRMRKLGHGHSVMFFAPLETDQSIRAVTGKDSYDIINASDILHWAMRETCNDIQQRTPQWAQQGMEYASRYRAWTGFFRDELTPVELSADWLKPEAKSLEDLYSPNHSLTSSSVTDPEIFARCARLGGLPLQITGMDEEQEREVIHEIERERQVERPSRALPAEHAIHPDIVTFVKTGVLPARSDAVRRVFETLSTTSAAMDEAPIWSPFVLATRDFSTTIVASSDEATGQYLRPVQWILSRKQLRNDLLVILSPHEVNHLLPYIRSSQYVHLHIYTARTSRLMIPCDDLRLYTVPTIPNNWTPPWALLDQLNVFSGQLYLRDYGAYLRLCRFLGVYTRDLKDDKGAEVGRESDGFIKPQNRPPWMEKVFTFQRSPLPPLHELVALRRKGVDFSTTHIGKVLGGRLLMDDDFEDS